MAGDMQHSPPRMSWKGGRLEEVVRFCSMVRRTRWQPEILRSSLRTLLGLKVVAAYLAGESSGLCSETDGRPASCRLLTMPTSWKALL
jgi:hypothetical protein